jgi:hypothetical protein
MSESQGKSFNIYIKKYVAKKLNDVDTTLIKEDIKRIINEQKK